MVLHKVSARRDKTRVRTVHKLFHFVSYGGTHSHLGIGMRKKTE